MSMLFKNSIFMKDNERVLASCGQVVLGTAQVAFPVNILSGPHETVCVPMSRQGLSLREVAGLDPLIRPFTPCLPLLALSVLVAGSLPLSR